MADEYWERIGRQVEALHAKRKAYFAKFVEIDRKMYDHFLKLGRARKRRNARARRAS